MQNELIDIYVEENDWLLSREYKHQLAKRLAAMNMSRQGTTDWLATVMNAHVETGGRIYDQDGDEIYIYDEIFDDAYFDDPSHCWNTNVKRFAEYVPKRKSSDRLLLRLQLFDAAFRILDDPIEQDEFESL